MIEKEKLYPLLFKPVYMPRMWGGSMMKEVLGRDVPDLGVPVGESWEIVDRDDAVSCVSNGELAGKTLRELVEEYGEDFVGKDFSGGKFPLLVKIIDAEKRLSLQVHPDEKACAAIGDGAEPKTEMWYIIAASKGASIMAGLKANATKMRFVESMRAPEVEKCLQVFDSAPGDAYFIKSGRVHAIGAGNLLLEIQQNSDTTYRVSDWGRVGTDGKPRELHLEKALQSIDFMDRTPPIARGASDSVGHNRKFPLINKCPYFEVWDLRLVERWRDNTGSTGSFHMITPINNPISISREDISVNVDPGCSCLIPACFGKYMINIKENSETTVIKTTL